MKKFIYAVAAVLSLCAVSCQKNDIDTGYLAGTWSLYRTFDEEDHYWQDAAEGEMYLTFNEDGTGSRYGRTTASIDFTYTVSDNVITMAGNSGESIRMIIDSLTENELVLIEEEIGDDYVDRYFGYYHRVE